MEGADCSDLVQVIDASRKVRALVGHLPDHFQIQPLPQKGGYTVVKCDPEGSKLLDQTKEEFKKDFVQTKEVSE